jgi:hypothetical protein
MPSSGRKWANEAMSIASGVKPAWPRRTMLPDKPWFFVTEAAELLGVSRRTIYNWIEAGKLEVCGCKYYQKVSRVSLLLQGGRR